MLSDPRRGERPTGPRAGDQSRLQFDFARGSLAVRDVEINHEMIQAILRMFGDHHEL